MTQNPVLAIGYTRINHKLMTDSRVSGGAYRYYYLLKYHAREDGVCSVRREVLASQLGCTKRTITRYNAELENTGYITREPGTDGTWLIRIKEGS
jgi:CTP-dependent riboflavin kinase